ncbi:MAG: hypothetical protein K9M07_01365 [Simkaniaceae bacterium]|nr:hypothetical protein [Simkaniaceae bacterium]
MNFTREPIIETIITPKDGFKLVVRNSKGKDVEEYSIDALEIVSFGGAIFYRSTEKPKAFLLPVSDFEVVEARESKVMLKSATIDKTIKIAGGKEPIKTPEEKEEQFTSASSGDKRKKRGKKKKGYEKKEEKFEPSKALPEGGMVPTTSHIKTLIPPPTTLISETISRYKAIGEESNEVILPETVEAAMEGHREHEPSDVLVPTDSLDPIWIEEMPNNDEQDNELLPESLSNEPLKIASSPEEDEPIGKTHAEERLEEDENPLHSLSERDDQE